MNSMRTRRGPGRRVAAGLALLLAWPLNAAAVPLDRTPPDVPAEEAPRPDEIIDADLRRAFEAEPQAAQEFWVVMDESADLSQVDADLDWTARGERTVDLLRTTSERTQAPVLRALDLTGTQYTPLWVTNAIHVEAPWQVARGLSTLDGVAELVPVAEIEPPRLEESEARPAPSALGDPAWGVEAIGAAQVWDEQGIRGDGIVVATIDTGAEALHPALIGSFRGLTEGGGLEMDHSWFDPLGGSATPVDEDGHGTHTTGTMVAEGAVRAGVAPGATWITARGCCTELALLESSQWMLAPTRVDGSDPRPDLRPHVVNNSWSTTAPSNEPFLEDIQEAWAASGIMGVWANGNLGPACATSGSPGSRTLNYSVGSYDATGSIATSSSRGPGQDGGVKPDLSAPGVDVVSTVPGAGFAAASGTSMAAPHVAGVVALLWSADPALVGDLDATRALLGGTAVDVDDTTCGGDADRNNVYGEGRLDAAAAVSEATGPITTGSVSGSVTDSDGTPVTGAKVQFTQDGMLRSTSSDDGAYQAQLAHGEYQVRVRATGYLPAEGTVTIGAEAAEADFELEALPSITLTGRAVDEAGDPVLGAAVSVFGTAASDVTDEQGRFTLSGAPSGEPISVGIDGHGCFTGPVTREVQSTTDVDLGAVELTRAVESINGREPRPNETPPFGYRCALEPTDWNDAPGERLPNPPLPGEYTDPIDLPFALPLHGEWVDTVRFDGALDLILVADDFSLEEVGLEGALRYCPAGGPTNGSEYRMSTGGAAPDRWVTFSALDIGNYLGDTYSCQATLHEDGDVVLAWGDVEDGSLVERGADTSVFLRSAISSGNQELKYADRQPLLTDTMSLRYTRPESGWIEGSVTDAASGDPLEEANVYLVDPDGRRAQTVVTGPDGEYTVAARAGGLSTVEAARPLGWDPAIIEVTVADREVADVDVELASADAQTSATVVAREGKTAAVELSNDPEASADLGWWALARTDPSGPDRGTVVSSDDLETDAPVQYGTAAGSSTTPDRYWVAVTEIASDWSEHLVLVDAQGRRTGTEIPLGPVQELVGEYPITMGIYGIAQPDPTQVCVVFMVNSPDIFCLDVTSGEVVDRIETEIPAERESNLAGLSYDPNRDRFYVIERPGWVGHGAIWTIAGPGSSDPGSTLAHCLDDRSVGALGFHPGLQQLIRVEGGRMSHVDPSTCAVTESLAVTLPGTDGAFPMTVAVDTAGDAFVLSTTLGGTAHVNLVSWDAPVGPASAGLDVWPGGTVPAGWSVPVDVEVDHQALPEDVDAAEVRVVGNNADRAEQRIGVDLVGAARNIARAAGPDRYATAAALAMGYAPGTPVHLATGEQYPDALTAAAQAGDDGGPVLLVKPDGVPRATRIALEHLRPEQVTVVGGESAISAATLEEVAGITGVAPSRIQGQDRYATAAALAQEASTTSTVYLATGADYADALTSSSVAGAQGSPVLLTRPDRLPLATAQAVADLQPERIVVVGGESAVSEEVLAQLGTDAEVTRVAGADRYATAVALVGPLDEVAGTYLASGRAWPDALAGAAVAGDRGLPVLLTRPDRLPAITADAVEQWDPGTVFVLGGSAAVDPQVESEVPGVR